MTEILQFLLNLVNSSVTTAFVTFFVVSSITVVAVWAFLVLALNRRDTAIETVIRPDTGTMPRAALLFLYFLGGLIAVGIVIAYSISTFAQSEGRAFVTVAALILLGIAAFIAIMNQLSRSASRLGMVDGRHPFGLPEGSVRAILTMAFIVLVGVLSAYLITSHNNRSPYAKDAHEVGQFSTAAAANTLAMDLRTQFQGDAIVAVTEDATVTPVVFRVVVHPRVDNSMGDDIAKQTLTMISTILAAMIGFYFAERSSPQNADPAKAVAAQLRDSIRSLATEAERALSQTEAEIEDARLALPVPVPAADTVAVEARRTKITEAQTRIDGLRVTLARDLALADDLSTPVDKLRAIETEMKRMLGTRAADMLR